MVRPLTLLAITCGSFALLVHCDGDEAPTVASDASVTGDAPSPHPDAAFCGAACEPLANPITLGALDCLATGWTKSDAGGELPSLPFYQPSIDASTINTVAEAPPALPTTNQYVIADGWDGPKPLIPITSWRMETYTGLKLGDPVASYQRGQVDAYGQSGIQAKGKQVGLWLNSQDALGVFYSGSASINSGCWYQMGPFARIFPSLATELDISFKTGVATDASTGNAHAQAYFQLIAVDTSGKCGAHCSFSVSIGYYSKLASNAATNGVSGDATGTLGSTPLAGGGIDSAGFFHKMPDSLSYQTSTFAPSLAHVRISTTEFLAMRNAVAAIVPAYSALSTNPLDYGLSLLNVNGETYDPCKDPTHIAPCGGSDHAQLGMSVEDFRVTQTTPHKALGSPWSGDDQGAAIVFRNGSGDLSLATDLPNSAAFQMNALPSGLSVAGDPTGVVVGGALHLFARDSASHLQHLVRNGATWTALVPSLADVASDPKALVDYAGNAQVVSRDLAGNVNAEAVSNDTTISRTIGAGSVGAPMGFVAACRTFVTYRDNADHVRLIDLSSGAGAADLSELAHATDNAYSDPQGFADQDGHANVIYRDINGKIHIFRGDGSTWSHEEISTASNAVPALGSPHAILAGCDPTIVYQGVDHHVHTLIQKSGAWSHRDLSAIRGALETYDDPAPFLDHSGVFRIDYRGVDTQIHELYGGPGWIHRDL